MWLGWRILDLYNATDQVYAVWSTTNLSTNFPTGWQVETEVFPTDTNCMPFTVQNLNRPNLFLYAEDWTGVRKMEIRRPIGGFGRTLRRRTCQTQTWTA